MSHWCRFPDFIFSWWGSYQYASDLYQIISSYNMTAFWKSGSVVSFDKVKGPRLHHAYSVTDQDRKIDGMRFWPLPPEFSYVGDNGRQSIEKHACGDAEPGRQRICGIIVTNGKSHLLRNVINKVIHHQRSNNDLKRLQLFLREQ